MPPSPSGREPSSGSPARSTSPLPARRFSDDEVRRILRRATDDAGRPSIGPADGLSLAELEAAAAGAGIDPGAVRRAALSSLPPPPRTLGSRIAGGPARFRHRIFVPGRLPPERVHEVTRALEHVLQREMELEDGGGYAVWEEDHRQGWTRVTVQEVEGGLRVGVEGDRRGWVTLAGIASVAAVATLAPFVGGWAVGTLGVPLPFFLLAAAALALGGLRLTWAPASRRLHRTLERAVAEVVARVEP